MSTSFPSYAPLPEPSGQDERTLLIEEAKRHQVRFVNLEFTDVVGIVKSVTIPVEQFPDCLAHDKWFDGSAIEGFARIAESDMYLRPDLSTFVLIPWSRSGEVTARIICDVLTPGGESYQGDPRAVLRRVLREAQEQGFGYVVAPELEFFLLQREKGTPAPLPHDQGSYFDLSTDLAASVRREMVSALQAMGQRIEASHHEVAAGQHELDFEPADALATADAIMTARYTLKAIAQVHGLYATFLPKPFYGINGSGMHIHQQLIRLKDQSNAFADPNDQEYGLTSLARHFLAGQLAHARGMTAILAPLVNSYKRLVPGYEAPVMISWGRVNREALLRVPRVNADQPQHARVELRSPDPSCNPYLALAVMLKAGLDGMKQQLPLPAPVEESLLMLDETARLRRHVGLLPATLGEALEDFKRDEIVREALGEHIAERFLEAKTIEWNDYRKQVHPWELKRYLDQF
ncbi:MAG TPA: glutamine synthetase family protein [Ktedonobacterales bacterium]|jgi:glutamine synthetase